MSATPHEPVDLDGAPLPVLKEYLRSAHAQERADAACALGDRLRTREITSYDAQMQEQLVELLGDPVPIVQFEAAIALAEAHDESAADILLEAIKLKTLRLDAIRALGTLGDRRAVAPLSQLLSRFLFPWADKLQAAAALCALGDDAGASYLKSKLESRRHAERAAAVHFIGESHHPEARDILESILATAHHPLRDVAARALGLLGDPQSVDALVAAKATADQDLLVDIESSLVLLAKSPRPA